VGQKAFSDGGEGGFRTSGIAYADFIYFMLAEEDRCSAVSLAYW